MLSDLEEKFTKEKIEGKAHIGLSRLDFNHQDSLGGGSGANLRQSRFMIGGYSNRNSRGPSMLKVEPPSSKKLKISGFANLEPESLL